MNPAIATARDIVNIVESTKDAMSAKQSSEHVSDVRRHAASLAVTSVVAAACGFLAVRSISHLKGASRKHHEWKVMDTKLDISLERAANTSEPTAAY